MATAVLPEVLFLLVVLLEVQVVAVIHQIVPTASLFVGATRYLWEVEKTRVECMIGTGGATASRAAAVTARVVAVEW